MRASLAISVLFAATTLVNAQEQEKKLLDRLLKPDMSLQSNVQGKQFTAGGATITKNARTKSFFVAERKAEKGFWNTGRFSAKAYPTETSRYQKSEAALATRTRIVKADVPYSTSTYETPESRDARKAATVSDYPGNRRFLGRGKSQKTLSAQDQPLTIDQVRELLNKNK